MSTGKAAHAGFAARLQLALEEAGFGKSQLSEVAKGFGVSSTAVRKWLDGEAMPVSKRAPGIAAVLGVRRAWLLDGELPMRPRPVSLERTAEAGKAYSSDDAALSISGDEFRLLSHYRKLPRPVQRAFGKLLEEAALATNRDDTR